ncbi:MAG: cell division ATPase MinD [Candidatus Aenigmarchaeota archaeon]|nr:cell division ATPase MinD [Candidatus Aenigmarchaeota archaeon]
MTRIIGVVSGKGGVGKTTVVANLGAVLANEFNRNTVIVDCNVTTSHLGIHMGLHYTPVTLNHVLKGEHHIYDALYEHESNVRIIPASLAVKDLSGMDLTKLRSYLQDLFGKVDFVLLDSAPGLGREALATIHASDEVLFVTTPYLTSAMDILRCKEVINELDLKELSPLGLVLNMVENKKHELKSTDIEKLTELPILATIPSDRKILQSLALKTPIVMLRPHAKPSIAFKKLGAAILKEKYKPSRFSELFGWIR